ASSIRYPTVFTGQERQVHLTGEAYFEVAPNTKMPFRVNVDEKATVEVLGTHFNVNAYANEEGINTTLLEGSIAFAVFSGQPVILQPGQQAQVRIDQKTQPGTNATTAKSGIKVINNADIDKIMAWKNGAFN